MMIDGKRTIAAARLLYQDFDGVWRTGRITYRTRMVGRIRVLARQCEDYWLRTGLLALAQAAEDPAWNGERIKAGLDGLLTNAVHNQRQKQKQKEQQDVTEAQAQQEQQPRPARSDRRTPTRDGQRRNPADPRRRP